MTPLHRIERELHVHGDALRALARALVGESDAEDLVQETALRALRSPPPQDGPMGGWLATTLRNIAWKHRRGARRRDRRERFAARPEAAPPPDATCYQRETLREITAAVLAIREPYQSTLLHRYFDGLTPTQIAERTGAALPTVKSRLQRALALVRDELDRRGRAGDWRAGFAAALHLPRPPKTPSIGGLWMAAQTRILVTAAAALALVGAIAFLAETGAPVAVEPTVDRELTAAAPRALAPSTEGASERREVAAEAAIEATIPPDPHAFAVRVRVMDRDGLPAVGRTVVAAPADCVPNAWPQPTDADGVVVLTWNARTTAMPITVGLRDDAGVVVLRKVEVHAGSPLDVTLLHDAPRCASNQSPRSDAAVFLPSCSACHAWAPRFRGPLDSHAPEQSPLHAASAFADLLLRSPPDQTLIMEDITEWSTAAGHERETGTIAGVVFDESGEPAPGVTVTWGLAADRPVGRTHTGADGSYRFAGLPPGTVEIRAGGGDEGLAQVRATAPEGGPPLRVDLSLAKAAVIEGRVHGTGGEPLVGYVVEFVTDDGTWADVCTTRTDGTFELPNQPIGPGSLLLTRSAGDLPIAVEHQVTAGGFEVDLDLRTTGPAEGALALRVRAPRPGRATEVRVWHTATGRARVCSRAADGGFVTRGLAAGHYRVEVSAEETGRIDLGVHWVDGRTRVDLGDVALPEPAELLLTGARGALGELFARTPIDEDEPVEEMTHDDTAGMLPELYSRRPYGDVRAEDGWALSLGRIALPPGEWLLLWRNDTAGPLRAATFRAAPAEQVTIDLR